MLKRVCVKRSKREESERYTAAVDIDLMIIRVADGARHVTADNTYS